jgi:hypothetical protein
MKRFGQVGYWLRGNWRRLAILTCLLALVGIAYTVGRSGAAVPEAAAVPPRPAMVQAPVTSVPKAEATDGSASRIVATIYDNIQITRQDFGEYLIARQTKRLDQFVNKRVIEHYCQERGVSVSDAEIDAEILQDLGKMSITPKQLLDQILSRYNMTFYEWREDVIRPQLMMKKVVRNMVSVTADDLKQAYEAEFGEKRDCRMIIWPEKMKHQVDTKIYDRIRHDDKEGNEEFERAARSQADSSLAACGGRLDKPLPHHSLKPEIEERVFRLKEGEVSEVMQDGHNLVVFKCDAIIPPVKNPPPLETMRDKYVAIITESKIRDEIPKVFKQMKEKANVTTHLPTPEAEKEWLLRAEKEFKQLKSDATKSEDN